MPKQCCGMCDYVAWHLSKRKWKAEKRAADWMEQLIGFVSELSLYSTLQPTRKSFFSLNYFPINVLAQQQSALKNKCPAAAMSTHTCNGMEGLINISNWRCSLSKHFGLLVSTNKDLIHRAHLIYGELWACHTNTQQQLQDCCATVPKYAYLNDHVLLFPLGQRLSLCSWVSVKCCLHSLQLMQRSLHL